MFASSLILTCTVLLAGSPVPQGAPLGSVQVRLTDLFGAVVPAAHVTIDEVGVGTRQASHYLLVTGVDGKGSFDGLSYGLYTVRISVSGFGQERFDVEVTAASPVVVIDAVLGSPCREASGRPIALSVSDRRRIIVQVLEIAGVGRETSVFTDRNISTLRSGDALNGWKLVILSNADLRKRKRKGDFDYFEVTDFRSKGCCVIVRLVEYCVVGGKTSVQCGRAWLFEFVPNQGTWRGRLVFTSIS